MEGKIGVLTVELSHVREDITDLRRAVGEKASREEVKDLKEEIRRLDNSKIGHDQFSIKEFSDLQVNSGNAHERIDDLDERTQALSQLTNLVNHTAKIDDDLREISRRTGKIDLVEERLKAFKDTVDDLQKDVKSLATFRAKAAGAIAVIAILTTVLIEVIKIAAEHYLKP